MAELINATDYPPDLTPLEKYDHVTTQAKLLANLSTTLARYLYEASTGSPPDDATKEILTANSSTVQRYFTSNVFTETKSFTQMFCLKLLHKVKRAARSSTLRNNGSAKGSFLFFPLGASISLRLFHINDWEVSPTVECAESHQGVLSSNPALSDSFGR